MRDRPLGVVIVRSDCQKPRSKDEIGIISRRVIDDLQSLSEQVADIEDCYHNRIAQSCSLFLESMCTIQAGNTEINLDMDSRSQAPSPLPTIQKEINFQNLISSISAVFEE
jgi:hypothetical protein